MIHGIFPRDLPLWCCLWQSTMFVALGLSVGYFLRHRPSRAYQVLLLAMIGATAVPLMSVIVKHFNLGVFTARVFELPPMMLPEEGVAGDLEQRGEMHGFSVPSAVPPALPDSTFTKMATATAKYSIPWRAVVIYGWMTATLILLARLVVTFIYGAHIVRRATRSACEQLQQTIDEVAFEFGFPHGLQVRSSKRVRSPVVWCWSRPSILLVPGTYMDPKIDWTGVVAHELAHCKRWDHVTGLVAELAACLFPWNPLMWLSKKYLIRFGERACDDWVIAAGRPSEDYAESLLRFRPQRHMAFLPAVVHSRKGLAGRVDRILKEGCVNPRMGVTWFLAVSVVAACLAASVAFAQTRLAKSATSIVEIQDTAIESLHKAAADGDIEQVKLFISKGANVNERDSWGKTPLHYACEKGYTEVVELLISRGAAVNTVSSERRMSPDWRKPLDYAAMGGHKQTVELLISKGADIDGQSERGRRLWFEAMRSPAGGKEVVQLLVARGAEIPELHLAAYMGDMEKLKKLLQEGENVNVPATYGFTALHAAVNGGNKDVVEFLISKGAKVDARDTFRLTPLYYAALHSYEDIGDLLLDKGSDINADDGGWTLLYDAILYDYYGDKGKDAIKLLISKGANVNIKDSAGCTPLHYAIWMDYGDIVETLINNGSDVNAEDNDGFTPYCCAVMRGRKDFVELLIAKGATPVSTIHWAACAGDLEKVKAFIEEGTDIDAKDKSGETPLFYAVRADNSDVAKFLIAKGANVNAKDSSGNTPLHFAPERAKNDVVELLIAKGADINAKSNNGETPLHAAIYFGRRKIAELFIAKGADVNAKHTHHSISGITPLYIACSRCRKEVAEALVAKGADVNTKDSNGQTPLHLACVRGHKDIAQLLIAKDADINARDNKEKTPLSLAKEQGHDEIVRLLVKHGAME